MAKDKKFGKGFFCGILTSAVVVLAGSGVLQQGGWITGADQKEAGATQESTDSAGTQLSLDQKKVDTKIKKMEEIINQLYLDSTDNDTVEAGIYKGMISGLGDPYAAYYTQDELEKLNESTSGEYKGIGAKLSQDTQTGAIQVVTCFEGTPAEKAGLLPGDILYSVNDIEVTGKDLTDVVSLIKTAKGDTVHLTIAREGEKDYLEFDVERSDVAVPTVAYKMLDDEIGYIAVSEFDKVTGLDLGADDYLSKPFHLAELHARLKSVLRRKQRDGEALLKYANVCVHPDSFKVEVDGKLIDLSRKEYDILVYFMNRPNRLIEKSILAEAVWGDSIDQADNFDFIYAQLKNLRKKLKEAGAELEIKTVYGFGYKLV